MDKDQCQIPVRDRGGTTVQCPVTVTEVGDDYNVSLSYGGVELSETAEDAFEAFAKIRTSLRNLGATACCYGASKNVFPSGMSRSMGGGVKAYRLTLGKQALMKDLVSIFDAGPDVEPVSPEEQEAFFKTWLASLHDG